MSSSKEERFEEQERFEEEERGVEQQRDGCPDPGAVQHAGGLDAATALGERTRGIDRLPCPRSPP
jgi:hypothetical protein